MTTVYDLAARPCHLGLGATAVPQPPFTGMAWYGDYIARHGDDGAEGRLISIHTFVQPWDVWEMHPAGSEVVVCLDGEITLVQQQDGSPETRLTLATGQYAINAPGVWHTADVAAPATCLFITAGIGTEHRQR